MTVKVMGCGEHICWNLEASRLMLHTLHMWNLPEICMEYEQVNRVKYFNFYLFISLFYKGKKKKNRNKTKQNKNHENGIHTQDKKRENK